MDIHKLIKVKNVYRYGANEYRPTCYENGMPTVEYVSWLEDEIMKSFDPDEIESQASRLLLFLKEKLNPEYANSQYKWVDIMTAINEYFSN